MRPFFLSPLIFIPTLVYGCLTAIEAKSNQTKVFPDPLVPLVNVLREVGYTVHFSKPPLAGAYGATDARKKKIWIAPISVDMGIARQVLIHEAVHAAQACPTGIYEPIGWRVSLPRSVEVTIKEILYRKYRRKNLAVEKEAFYMQSHPQAFKEITSALRERCQQLVNDKAMQP